MINKVWSLRLLASYGVQILWMSFVITALGLVVYGVKWFLEVGDIYEAVHYLWYPKDEGWALGGFFLWLIPSFVLGAYLSIFILPIIVLLPVVAPLNLLWKDPYKFLILRSFNRGWPNSALRRMARRQLSDLGHVYTLADKNIKVPWTTRAVVILGQFSLFSFRVKRLTRIDQVESLNRVLSRTWFRNVNWCLSLSKIFVITCSDLVWQACVSRLIASVDAVLIDVSEMRPNIIWEVTCSKALGMENRVLYLLAKESDQKILPLLSSILGYQPDPSQVVLYSIRNSVEESLLHEKVMRILQNPIKSPSSLETATLSSPLQITAPDTSSKWIIGRRVKALVSTGLGMFAVFHQAWLYYYFLIRPDFGRALAVYSPIIVLIALVFGFSMFFALSKAKSVMAAKGIIIIFVISVVILQLISFPTKDEYGDTTPLNQMIEYMSVFLCYPGCIEYEHIASEERVKTIAARIKYRDALPKKVIVLSTSSFAWEGENYVELSASRS